MQFFHTTNSKLLLHPTCFKGRPLKNKHNLQSSLYTVTMIARSIAYRCSKNIFASKIEDLPGTFQPKVVTTHKTKGNGKLISCNVYRNLSQVTSWLLGLLKPPHLKKHSLILLRYYFRSLILNYLLSLFINIFYLFIYFYNHVDNSCNNQLNNLN